MQDQSFVIKTEKFEGPLDLLLHLIEERKFLINDISLSKITDDYIEYVRNLDGRTLKQNSDFILIASTMLLIKSRSILPTLTISDEEERDIDDLERRLKLYKKIKELGLIVQNQFGAKILFIGEGGHDETVVFSPDKNINLAKLGSVINNFILSLPKKEFRPEIKVKKVISLEDMIGNLITRIKTGMRMTFKEFSGAHKKERVNIIVGFLAMLELIKQGKIIASQGERFGDIVMESDIVDTPSYS